MDLDRYLGLPAPASAERAEGEAVRAQPRRDTFSVGLALPGRVWVAPREPLLRRLGQRVFLVGSLTFAIVWFVVVKLKLLDAVPAVVLLGTSIALGAAATALVLRSRARGEDDALLAGRATASLREGDVTSAIEIAKSRLGVGPAPLRRAEVESSLALCAAFETRLDEALLIAEMSVTSLSHARRTREAAELAARLDALLAFVHALRGQVNAERPNLTARSGDPETALNVARTRLVEAARRGADAEVETQARALRERHSAVATAFDLALARALGDRAAARTAGAYRTTASPDDVHPGAEAAPTAGAQDPVERFAAFVTRTIDGASESE